MRALSGKLNSRYVSVTVIVRFNITRSKKLFRNKLEYPVGHFFSGSCKLSAQNVVRVCRKDIYERLALVCLIDIEAWESLQNEKIREETNDVARIAEILQRMETFREHTTETIVRQFFSRSMLRRV